MWNAADEAIQMPWLRFLGPSSLGVFAAGCQIQACVILLGFVAAWHWAARRRFIGRRELARRGTTRTVWCKPDEAPEAASKRSARGSVSHQGGGRAYSKAGGAGGRKDVRSSDTGPVPRSLTSVLPQEGASGRGVPKVSVIMPVKGIHSESLANWRTQLTTGRARARCTLLKGYTLLRERVVRPGRRMRLRTGTMVRCEHAVRLSRKETRQS